MSVPIAGCRRPEYPSPPRAPRFFTPKELAVIDAAARRLLPGGQGRLGAEAIEVAAAADELFARANPRLQADLKQLLNSFEDMTWLSLRFTPFTTMAPGEQDAYLRAWAESPLGVQRQGAIALGKLVSMLFYTDPRAWKQIGYPGPWIGRYDFGLGLDNQGPLSANPNPNVFARFGA